MIKWVNNIKLYCEKKSLGNVLFVEVRMFRSRNIITDADSRLHSAVIRVKPQNTLTAFRRTTM